MLEIFLAPVLAALIVGSVIKAFTGDPVPRSFDDLFVHFLVGAIAGFLGVFTPAPRIEDVSVLVRLAPALAFAVLAIAVFIAR